MTKRMTTKPRTRSTTKAMARTSKYSSMAASTWVPKIVMRMPTRKKRPPRPNEGGEHEASEVETEGASADGEDFVGDGGEGGDGDGPDVAALVLPLNVEDAVLGEEPVQQGAAATQADPVAQHCAEQRARGGNGRETEGEL